MNVIVTISERVYRLLLNIYPRPFRDEYGEEMAQLIRDQASQAWADHRVIGVLVLWLKVLWDTARSATAEHVATLDVHSNRRGLAYGLATAIGFPLAFVSFGSDQFWSAVVWVGQSIGLQTSNNWLHPVIAVPAFLLAGIGLYGLYRRLPITSKAKKLLSGGAVALGVTLSLLGLAIVYSPIYGPTFLAGWYSPAGFGLITFGLGVMGVVAVRARTFGSLSFVPLAVVGSAVLFFVTLATGTASRFPLLEVSTRLIHVALWVVLGLLIWASPPESNNPIQAT